MSQAANVMLEHLTNYEETYDIPALRDALGRIVLRHRVVANGLDQVLDLRGLGAGQYTVELQRNGLTLDAQKLSVE